jgi:hypothetical protein
MSKVRVPRFNDGQAVDHTDFNKMADFLQAQNFDLWQSLARTTSTGVAASVSHLFAMANGGAPHPSATTRSVTHLPGWVAQQTGDGSSAISGDEPEFLYYYLDTDELETQLTAGHATLPRIDLLCVKLERVDDATEERQFEDATTRAKSTEEIVPTRSVTVTKQLVAGTPNASPTVPAVPAGYVPLVGVYVPATWNTTIDAENIWDYRMPVGFTVREESLGEWVQTHENAAGTWVNFGSYIGTALCTALTSGEAIITHFPRNIVPQTMRLIGISLMSGNYDDTDVTCKLIRGINFGATGDFDAIEDVPDESLTSDLLGTGTGVDTDMRTRSYTARAPVWAGGYRSGYAARDGQIDDISRLGFLLRQTATSPGGGYSIIRYLFAGGL